MITGYNTDVKHDGKVFHVQTEDKGVANPILETLVYVGGGQIVASKQHSYATLVVDGKCDDRALSELLDSQHRRMLRWVTGGKFDPNGPPPFGSTIISPRSFDEVVTDFIRSQEGAEPIEIVMVEEIRAVAGAASAVKILVRSEVSNTPAGGAQVSIALHPPTGAPVRILASAAGADGSVAGKIKCPVDAAGGFLRIEAHHGGQVETLDVPIVAP